MQLTTFIIVYFITQLSRVPSCRDN